MSRHTILFVLPDFAGGGAERVALSFLGALDRHRFTPSLIVFQDAGPLRGLVPADVPTVNLRRPRLRSALVPMVRQIRRSRPDVVFSTLGYVNLALLAARPLLPPLTWIVVREANLPSLSLVENDRSGAMRLGYRFLYRRADAIVATSRRMVDEFRDDFQVPGERLHLLPNPVDVDGIRNRAVPLQRHPGRGLRLVAAGRLTRQKGFDRLIEMLPGLPSDTHVTVLGDGPLLPDLTAQALATGVADRIDFRGFTDNPYSWFAGADAFLMASRWEGLPNAVLEALACGTSVIATPESGGIIDIQGAAHNGAVTIAPIGAAFAKAIGCVKVSETATVRPSLLPNKYLLEIVAGRLQEIVDDSLKGLKSGTPASRRRYL